MIAIKDLDMGMGARITILADGNAGAAWYGEPGFSAHASVDGASFLFDAGLTGLCVAANATEFKVDLRALDGIVLSHGHSDHSSGLEAVLRASGPKTVHAHPGVLGKKYAVRGDGRAVYAGIPYVRDYVEHGLFGSFAFHAEPFRLGPRLLMLPEAPRSNDFERIPDEMRLMAEDGSLVPDTLADDNSLVLDTPRGLVFLFGCAHRGIVNIMEYGKRLLGKEVYGFVGGTHLKGASDGQFERTVEYLRGLRLGFMAPCHCTGDERVFRLRTIFEEVFVPVSCGTSFVF